jgi:hypothetical protein
MMSNSQTTTNIDVLSIVEAASYANVSTKTIERYAILYKWESLSEVRNSRKIKVYRKSDIDKHFKNQEQKSDTSKTTTNKKPENKENPSLDSINCLKDEVVFLRSELVVKNEQISKLIESESKTKMLLADLQVKVKTLPAPEPAKAEVKKHTWVWWTAFFLLVGALGFGAWLAYDYLKNLL